MSVVADRLPDYAEIYRAQLHGRRRWRLSLWHRFADPANAPSAPSEAAAVGDVSLEYGSKSGESMWTPLLPSGLRARLRDPQGTIYAELQSALQAGARDSDFRVHLQSDGGALAWMGALRLDGVETALRGQTRVPTVELRAYCGLAAPEKMAQPLGEEDTLADLYRHSLHGALAPWDLRYVQQITPSNMAASGPTMDRVALPALFLYRDGNAPDNFGMHRPRKESLSVAAQSCLQRVWQGMDRRWRVEQPFRFNSDVYTEEDTRTGTDGDGRPTFELTRVDHDADPPPAPVFGAAEARQTPGEITARVTIERSIDESDEATLTDLVPGSNIREDDFVDRTTPAYFRTQGSPNRSRYTKGDSEEDCSIRLFGGGEEDRITREVLWVSRENDDLRLKVSVRYYPENNSDRTNIGPTRHILLRSPAAGGTTYHVERGSGGYSWEKGEGGDALLRSSESWMQDDITLKGEDWPATGLLEIAVSNDIDSTDVYVDAFSVAPVDKDGAAVGAMDLTSKFGPGAYERGGYVRSGQQLDISRPFIAPVVRDASDIAAAATESPHFLRETPDGAAREYEQRSIDRWGLPDGTAFADLADLQAELILRRNNSRRLRRVEGQVRGLFPPERPIRVAQGSRDYVLLHGTLDILRETTDGAWVERPPVGADSA